MKIINSLIRKIASCILIIGLIFIFTSCGEDTEETLNNVKENMESVESISIDSQFHMDIVFKGEKIKSDKTAKNDYIVGSQAKIDSEETIDGLGGMKTLQYHIEEDGKYNIYTGTSLTDNTSNFSDDMTWSKKTYKHIDLKSSISPFYPLSAIENLKKKGVEKIRNINEVRYEGIVKPYYIEDILRNSGVVASFDSLGIIEASYFLEAQYDQIEGISDLHISVWIDKENNTLLKSEVDLTEIMKDLINDSIGKQNDVIIDKIESSITYSNINNVDKIVIPKEALSA